MEPAMTTTDSGPSWRACAVASSTPSRTVRGHGVLDAERLRQGGKFVDGSATGIIGCTGENHVRHPGPENFRDLVHGFVGHGSEEQNQGTFAKLLGEGCAQSPGSGGIVGDVKNDLRALGGGGDALKASGPGSLARTGRDGFRCDVEALGGKFLGSGDGERKIAKLMASDEGRNDLHLLAQNTQLKSCLRR